MKIDELIRDLKYTVLHLPWSQIRQDADQVVERVAQTLEAQQGRITELEAELKEERYRHDRVQDFEVAEAQVLAKLRQERRWIPVGERLPEYDQVVLCYKDDRGVRAGKHMPATYADGVVAFKDLAMDYAFGATHWMPLPEPPEVDG